LPKSEKHCPLCNIPERERLEWKNQLVYVVPTKDLKGHKIRAMSATYRHTTKPTFEELSYAYAALISYMEQKTSKFYIAAPKKPSVSDHFHIVACDEHFSNLDEKEHLFTNPHIELPIPSKIIIGIPAHNETENIKRIITQALKYGDVVAVDDGSTDNTSYLIFLSGAKLLMHNKNLGYGASIRNIFNYAKENNYDTLITLDADGQHNPEEIPKFLEALKSSDIVIGNRFMSKIKMPKYRKFGIMAISKFISIGDTQCGFRAYNKKAILSISDNIHEKGMGASVEILKISEKKGLRITEVPCTIKYGKEKHSQNPLSHGINLVTAFFVTSLWMNPTKLLGPFGLLSLITALVAGIQTINIYAQFKIIVLSWALLTVSSIICTLLIFNALSIILILKNKRMYEK